MDERKPDFRIVVCRNSREQADSYNEMIGRAIHRVPSSRGTAMERIDRSASTA